MTEKEADVMGAEMTRKVRRNDALELHADELEAVALRWDQASSAGSKARIASNGMALLHRLIFPS